MFHSTYVIGHFTDEFIAAVHYRKPDVEQFVNREKMHSKKHEKN